MCSLKKEILEMLSGKCAEVGVGYWAAGHKRSLRGAGLSGLIPVSGFLPFFGLLLHG